MKSWIFAFVGLTCLVSSLSLTAIGQTAPPQGSASQGATTQASLKEIKFKLEWIQTTTRTPAVPNSVPETETISLATMDGETAMTANKLVSTELYRRVTIHPETQKDGSVLVDVSVTEFSKDSERDTPRISTRVRLKGSDTRVIQSRVSKGLGYEFEYVLSISMDQ